VIRERLTRVVWVLAALVCVARAAPAQTAVTGPERRGPAFELDVAGVFTVPVTLGQSTATYRRPDGSLFALFRTDDRAAAGLGAEVHAGVGISSRISVEGTAGWSRTELRSEITSDVEGSTGDVLSDRITRFKAEGSVVCTLVQKGATSFFARGGVGLMRELSSDGIYAVNGTIGNAGAGVKYWKHTSSGRRRLGLRVEGRAAIRARGISVGSSTTVIAPEISGGVMFGF
jgi:hypothetical protein